MWEYVAKKWKDGKNMFNPMVISNSLGKIVGRVHTTLRNSLIQGIHTYYSKHGKFYQVQQACHTWWRCEIKSSFHFCRGRNMQPLALEVLLKDEHIVFWPSRKLGYVNIARGNEKDFIIILNAHNY
jgi:hypothetical protein